MTTGPGTAPPSLRTCYRHPDRETYVSCTRCGRAICPACMRPASVGFHCPEEGGSRARAARTVLGGRATDGRPIVTWILIGINVVVFLALGTSAFTVSGEPSSSLFYRLVLYPPNVALHHDYYRLVSSMFLHLNLIHIGLNMYALYLIGPPLERVLGRTRYLALYLLAGLGGSALAYAIGPVGGVEAGASGAIFGLFAAFALVSRRLRLDARPILVVIGLNLVLSFTLSGISWQGHIGGLVAGAVVGAALAYAPARNRLPVQVGVSLLVAVVIVAAIVLRTHELTTSLPLGTTVLPG